jgi:glycosyltransferase involved in cell wall biosynthesis
MSPKVSVLVITYNQKEFIRETIESVLDQSYENIEYVIADDGSTDGTAAIIDEYASKFPGVIKAITNCPNLGITKNSNRGLALCTGEYIALQGGDDVFFTEKVKKQVAWFEQDKNRNLCGHFLHLCDEKSNIIGNYQTQNITGKGARTWIEKGPLFGATSVMIRSAAVPKHGFDERLPIVSDWKFYIDCLGSDKLFGFVPEFLGLYRKHDNNVTNVKEPVMQDAETTFKLISLQTSDYKLSVRIGKAYILFYGRGIQQLEQTNYKQAIQFFIKSIAYWPFNWKPYVRVIQTLPKLFK